MSFDQGKKRMRLLESSKRRCKSILAKRFDSDWRKLLQDDQVVLNWSQLRQATKEVREVKFDIELYLRIICLIHCLTYAMEHFKLVSWERHFKAQWTPFSPGANLLQKRLNLQVVQVNLTLTFHPSCASENEKTKNSSPVNVKTFPRGFGRVRYFASWASPAREGGLKGRRGSFIRSSALHPCCRATSSLFSRDKDTAFSHNALTSRNDLTIVKFYRLL